MARVEVPVTDQQPPKAALTTALTGTLNDLVFTAKKGGPGGDAITVAYVDPAAASQALSVDVAGAAITVNLATDAASAITSTAALVRNAILGQSDSSALVDVDLVDAGTGVVTAMTAASLAGGSWEITPPAETDGDATNGHFISGNTGIEYVEFRNSGVTLRTVTLHYAPGIALGATVANETFDVPAGATRKLAGLRQSWFNQNRAGEVWFDVSHAELKMLAYRPVLVT